jgi:hypothetical protein
MLYAIRYASAVPYQMLALGGVLNMAIILTLVVSITRVYRRMQGVSTAEESQPSQTRSEYSVDVDRRRLKRLWIGVGLYSLIFFNGLRLGLAYAGELPLLSIIFAEVLNGAILTTFILTLWKVRKRIQQAERLASNR